MKKIFTMIILTLCLVSCTTEETVYVESSNRTYQAYLNIGGWFPNAELNGTPISSTHFNGRPFTVRTGDKLVMSGGSIVLYLDDDMKINTSGSATYIVE
jgi:hypothetical protein